MKGLIGIKIGMSQVFDESGVVTPVTIIQAGPCFVTQIKDQSGDGYTALQLGFGDISQKRLTQGQKGHLGLESKAKKGDAIPPLRHLKEFRTRSTDDYQVGQQLTVEQFEVGGRVDVTGQTKGRGFAGAVKRYGFRGGPKTHGQSDRHRAVGSIGGTTGVGRVFKGKRMPGRMGNERQTAQNLEIMRVDADRSLIAVKGAIPGRKGGLVFIRDAAKGQ